MAIEIKSDNMKSIRLTFHESLSLLRFVRDLMESSIAQALLFKLEEYCETRMVTKEGPSIEGHVTNYAYDMLSSLSDTLVGWTNLEKVTNTQKSINVDTELIIQISEVAKYRMLRHQEKINSLCADVNLNNTAETIQKIHQSTKDMMDEIEIYIILTR